MIIEISSFKANLPGVVQKKRLQYSASVHDTYIFSRYS